jgi:hypothetical protein
MAQFEEAPVISGQYIEAMKWAAILHGSQLRKDGSPYLAHLQMVAAGCLQMEDEEAAIAAWFHDTLEDLPLAIAEAMPHLLYGGVQQKFGWTAAGEIAKYHNQVNRYSIEEWRELSLQEKADSIELALDRLIENKFGNKVLDIVKIVTEEKSLPKRDRKMAYGYSLLTTQNKSALLVALWDKWHNLELGYSLEDLELKPDVLEFYETMLKVFRTRFRDNPTAMKIAGRIENRVNEMALVTKMQTLQQ